MPKTKNDATQDPEIPEDVPKSKGRAKKTETSKTATPKKTAPKKTALTVGMDFLRKNLKDADDDPVPTNQNLRESRPHIPTGSFIVDYVIGGQPNRFGVPPCPGFPRARLVNLYGQESAGKTTLCLMAAARVIQQGGTVAYIDWEHAIDLSYSASLGVDIEDTDHFMLIQPRSLERGLAYVVTMARAGVDLIVIDSVGAGVPQAILDQKADEEGQGGRIGLNAAIWSKHLPKLKGIIARTNVCVIGISQLRQNINTSGYGGETDLPQGGKAWGFYSELKIRLKRIGTETGTRYDPLTHKKDKVPTGMKVRVKIDKCKVSANQNKVADFYVTFGEGIDDWRAVMEIALNHSIIKRSGPQYSYEMPDGEQVKAQGKDAFKALLKSRPDVWDAVKQAVTARLTTGQAVTEELVPEVQDDDFSDLDFVTGMQDNE